MPESSVLERDELSSRSHLFMLRVWLEDLSDGKTEWRGKVQCVASGEVQYFRDWQTLIVDLETMLTTNTTISLRLKSCRV
jgi:hypothetical protein